MCAEKRAIDFYGFGMDFYGFDMDFYDFTMGKNDSPGIPCAKLVKLL